MSRRTPDAPAVADDVGEDVLVRLDGVELGYGGAPAVRALDLTVAPGELVALVGGDGAGRTTVLRAVTGRLAPSAGRATLPSSGDVGVVPESGASWPDLTVAENLDFARAAHGVASGRAVELGERMGLAEASGRLAGRLSGGMRQKLALAMALQHRPALLALDEPTTGVDPVSRAEIWRLLSEEVADGRAVLLATTYLDEAARATRVVLLDRGRVLARGAPEEVAAATPGQVVAAAERRGEHAWRRGRSWRTWLPEGGGRADDVVQPDLEDAAIVAALRAEQEEAA